MFSPLPIFLSLLKWHEFISCSIFCISATSNINRLRLAAVVIFCRHPFFKSLFACFLHCFCQHRGLILYSDNFFYSQLVHKISMLWSRQRFLLDIHATPILQCSLLVLYQTWQKLNKSCEMQLPNLSGLTGSGQPSSVIKIKVLDYEWQHWAAGVHLLSPLWESGNLHRTKWLYGKFLH